MSDASLKTTGSMERTFRGAVIRNRMAAPAGTVAREATVVSDGHNEAYMLAVANKNKSWARRWLRANGYWRDL